jgi:Ca2+-binding RTX toxin-like protein
MATVTISVPKVILGVADTPGATLNAGDTLDVLANTGIYNYGTGGSSDGVFGAGSNSVFLNGDIFAANGSGLRIATGGNDINVGAACTINSLHSDGIYIPDSNSAISIAGKVIAGFNAIETRGQNTITIHAGGSAIGDSSGLVLTGDSNIVMVAGEVHGWNHRAVYGLGSELNVITVTSTGQLTGGGGVEFSNGTGANQLINNGSILSTVNDAVTFDQAGSSVVNTGTIIAATAVPAPLGNYAVRFNGIGAAGVKNTLVNSGTVAGGTIYTVQGESGVDEITNSGTILGLSGNGAISTGAGNDIVLNTGVIQGNATSAIVLGDGNDTYNGAGGVVNGTVFGGNNDDILIGGAGVDVFDGGSGANTMVGGGGNDTLTAAGNLNVANGDDGSDSVAITGNQNQLSGGNGNDWLGVSGSNNALSAGAGDDFLGATGMGNTIVGGDGNDTLQGNGAGNFLYGQTGNDWVGVSGNNNSLDGAQGDDYLGATGNGNVLDGGAGNDQLVAGAHSSDRFVFHAGYGLDSITGFARHGGGGTDVIDLNGFGLNFSSLQPFLSTVGGNAVVTINAATVLTVVGVASAQLQANDFVF